LLLLEATFYYPYDVLVHPITGDVYISDRENNAIRVVNSTGTITTIAGNGTGGYTGDGGPASDALLFNPVGLIATQNGVFFADSGNHAIRRIDI